VRNCATAAGVSVFYALRVGLVTRPHDWRRAAGPRRISLTEINRLELAGAGHQKKDLGCPLDKEASHAYHERSKVSIGMSVAAVFNAIDEWILCMKNSSTPCVRALLTAPQKALANRLTRPSN